MNEEFNSALTYLIAFVLFLTKTFFNEVILVDTNRIIKGPNLEFGGFLGFIGIRWLRTEKCGTNGAEYFSKNTIDILVGDKFVSTILCLEFVLKVSSLLSISLTSLPPFLSRLILSSLTDDCCMEWSHAKSLHNILDIMFG